MGNIAAKCHFARGLGLGDAERQGAGLRSQREVRPDVRAARFNEDIPGVIELYTVLCAESVTEGHPGREYFTERFERLRRSYTRQLSQLAAEGRLRPGVTPEAAAASLIALWDGIQTQWLLAPGSVDMAGCLRG